jgi:hypothetical protein
MKTPIKFRGSFAPIMSAIKIGPEITRLTIDVPKSEQLNAVGLQALLESPLLFSVMADDSPASTRIERPDDKPNGKPKKGEHGAYWSVMFKAGFQNYPDLIQVLDCAGDQVRLRLHDIFETDSLTNVSHAQFEDWCAGEGLHSLITLSRQARAKLAA